MIERVSVTQAAYALAICRIVVFLVLSFDVWAIGDPTRIAALPRDWYVAQGPFRWLPGAFYAAVFDPTFLSGLRWSALAVAGVAATGLRPYPLFAGVFCVLYLLLRALAAGFGGFIGHGWLALTFCSWVLAVFPAAAVLALGRARPLARRAELYTAPIVAMGALFCTCYFLLGLRRFARGGLEIFWNDALPTYIGLASLKDGAYGGFEYGVLILTSPLAAVAMKAGYFVVTVMEVLAPLCVLSGGFRWLWLAVMIPFHLSTLLTMNIFFDNNIVLMLLSLTPLPFWLGAKLAGIQAGGSRVPRRCE